MRTEHGSSESQAVVSPAAKFGLERVLKFFQSKAESHLQSIAVLCKNLHAR